MPRKYCFTLLLVGGLCSFSPALASQPSQPEVMAELSVPMDALPLLLAEGRTRNSDDASTGEKSSESDKSSKTSKSESEKSAQTQSTQDVKKVESKSKTEVEQKPPPPGAMSDQDRAALNATHGMRFGVGFTVGPAGVGPSLHVGVGEKGIVSGTIFPFFLKDSGLLLSTGLRYSHQIVRTSGYRIYGVGSLGYFNVFGDKWTFPGAGVGAEWSVAGMRHAKFWLDLCVTAILNPTAEEGGSLQYVLPLPSAGVTWSF